MTKQIANIITSCRILCSIVIMFLHIPSFPFLILYVICGLSDVLDGIIARKTNTTSNFGEKLDTIADFIFVTILLIKILYAVEVPIVLWIWIILIAGIKVANVMFGFIHKKRLVVEHTLLNKCTGVLLFLLPLALLWIEFKYSAMVVCIVVTLSTLCDNNRCTFVENCKIRKK